jgi:mannose-1-phosphate guanylyltransferase
LNQIPEINRSNLIIEPVRKNTAPAVAYAAFKINALNPNANLVVAPSDHLILKEKLFLEILQKAVDFASSNDVLMTLGIKPDKPNTGYGYIEISDDAAADNTGMYRVQSFREKPDLNTAEYYLSTGKYLWNSGIFIFNTRSVLSALQKYAPDIYDPLSQGKDFYNTDREMDFLIDHYQKTPSISFDYAVLEKADNIFTSMADISWSDLGTWNSLHSILKKDKNNNALIDATANTENSHGNIIKAPKYKFVYIRDLDNFIIVDENNTLLIYPIDKEQDIKNIEKH